VNPAKRPGRRTWVYLGRHADGSCVVWNRRRNQWCVEQQLSAYHMTCVLKHGRRPTSRLGELPRDMRIGLDTAQLLSGDVVYAFYSKALHAIKIGRTTDVIKRWAQLENSSGELRQLLSVWRCPDTKALERDLHMRWADSRTIGEWFAADALIGDLRAMVTGSQVPAAAR